ncbi:MAG: hypothetical protein GWO20_14295 [Candidatus Korarchaeota archaeon]|nr:hypothetical protein [Candidatus Korarchaeota archaeon]NIU84584.1 hypothetical protein [Candidatus Thorarchaeota archaeon]NIW14642.1 hypothetical protein [Candidatus Thorarchaeota archaeon]NIW52719.1 hypothetical protein [Candidatus Korarchaeota archaeon]
MRRGLLFEEVFTHLPSSLETLSILFRTSVAVKGKHYTSIPSAPYLGEMVTAWSQVLNTMEKAASGHNTRGHLNEQLGGAVRFFFNSNSFLTDVLARNVLLGLHGLWRKETWVGENRGKMSDTERVLYGILSNDNYPIGRVNYCYYKNHENWPIKRRLEYFAGYWFVGEKAPGYREEGESLLRDLGENKEIDKEKLSNAISNFKDRMRVGRGPKAQVGAAMRHTFQKLLSKCYSKVTSQVQISAVRVGNADSMEELSLALTRLAYSQDAYKLKSRLGILFSDAVRAIRNAPKRPENFKNRDPTEDTYSYENLITELETLAKPPKNQYECGHILEQIKDTGIKEDDSEDYFEEFQELHSTVEDGIVDHKGLLPHFRRKNAKAILEDIKNGEVFEGLDVDDENKEEIKNRLGALIENGYLLVKKGEFKVMGVSEEAQLLGMYMRIRALGMIEEELGGDFREETITWSLSKMQNLMQYASEERKKEMVEGLSLEEARNLVFRSVEEESLFLLFSGKKSSGGRGKINELRELLMSKILDEYKEGNHEKAGKLVNLYEKLSEDYIEEKIEEIKETALTLETAMKRNKNGEIVIDEEDGKPELSKDAKKSLRKGLIAMGFSEEDAEEMSKDLEEAVREEMTERLKAKKMQKRKRTAAKVFMALTPLGGIGLVVHRIIEYIMSNTRLQALLQNSFMGKVAKRLKKGKIGGYVRNIIQNFYTGFIVALMSFIGMVIGTLVVRFTTDKKGLEEALKGDGDRDLGDALQENSPLLGFLWFKLPAVVWIVISAVLFPLVLVLISNKYLKEISLGKGGAAIFTGITDIWAYADMNGKGMFGSIPFFVSLSGMLWIWDEFDDFQDAKDQITHDSDDGTELVDYAELFLLPFVLGFFGTMFGITDPRAFVIPGQLGFMKYTSTLFPKPWNWIFHALYQVVATLIGGIVASGGVGGFAIYMIGSVLANFSMRGVLSAIS